MSVSREAVNQQMARGIAWSLAMRWAMRFIGLVNVVILFRLLTPNDMGVAATAMITFGLIESLAELGIQQHLIRAKNIGREQIDTAWTMTILQQSFAALVILLLAPLAAAYFDEPRIVPVTWVLAIATLIAGFTNIGLVIARRELNYELDYWFNVYQRFGQFIATVALAFALRSYWALVLGQLANSVLSIVLSYRMHPYRPRFSLAHAGEYLRFGSAIIPQRLGKTLHNRLDAILVGGFADTTQMGLYNVASRLAEMSANELAIPVGRGLYPNFATLIKYPKELAAAFVRVLSPVSAFIFPVAVTFWIVAEDFVAFFFGEQWMPAVPYLQWLVLYAAFESMTMIMSQQILIVVGHERRAAIFMWAKVAILAVCLLWGHAWRGVEGIAIMRPFVAALTFSIAGVLLIHSTEITAQSLLQALWRPVAAAVATYLGVELLIEPHLPVIALLRLAVEVPAAGAIYASCTAALWLASGRPEGAEQAILERYAKFRSRRAQGVPT